VPSRKVVGRGLARSRCRLLSGGGLPRSLQARACSPKVVGRIAGRAVRLRLTTGGGLPLPIPDRPPASRRAVLFTGGSPGPSPHHPDLLVTPSFPRPPPSFPRPPPSLPRPPPSFPRPSPSFPRKRESSPALTRHSPRACAALLLPRPSRSLVPRPCHSRRPSFEPPVIPAPSSVTPAPSSVIPAQAGIQPGPHSPLASRLRGSLAPPSFPLPRPAPLSFAPPIIRAPGYSRALLRHSRALLRHSRASGNPARPSLATRLAPARLSCSPVLPAPSSRAPVIRAAHHSSPGLFPSPPPSLPRPPPSFSGALLALPPPSVTPPPFSVIPAQAGIQRGLPDR